jgi:hypothetical protein
MYLSPEGATIADKQPFVNVNAAIPNPLFLKKSRRVAISLIKIIAAKVAKKDKGDTMKSKKDTFLPSVEYGMLQ